MNPADEKLLREIIATGRRLEKLWPVTSQTSPSFQTLELLNALKSLIEKTANAESSELSRLSFHTRNLTVEMSARHLAGILVPFERLSGRALSDDEFLVTTEDAPSESERSVAPLIVVADNIRSAFNVGAIFRTAEAFGAERVVLSGYTPTPEDDKTARTSLGADRSIPWEQATHAREAIARLRSQGYSLVALETSKRAISLDDFTWPEKTALLLGNERFGLDHDVLAEADHLVKIPLFGHKNSLNVGIAFGIAAAAWRRSSQEHMLHPIGIFRAKTKYPYDARRQGSRDDSGEIGVIELKRGHQFEQALDGLEGFDRLWVIYRFHHNENWKPMVLPPRGPRIKRGVFATRSPYRPNPIGLSTVELVKIEGQRVYIRGFDLLDETPIYDLKPYLPYADAFPSARTGWTEGLEAQSYQVSFSENAERKLSWLEERGLSALRGFLKGQLEYDPLDNERKRVEESSRDFYRIAYRTWRADFTLDESLRKIRVAEILSGYSTSDLEAGNEDRYGDKDLHRDFLSRFFSQPKT